jgi:hypothetical protein
MPNYTVKSRKTGPVVLTVVSALSREEAISQVVQTAAPGEEVEIMDAKEGAAEEVQPSKR